MKPIRLFYAKFHWKKKRVRKINQHFYFSFFFFFAWFFFFFFLFFLKNRILFRILLACFVCLSVCLFVFTFITSTTWTDSYQLPHHGVPAGETLKIHNPVPQVKFKQTSPCNPNSCDKPPANPRDVSSLTANSIRARKELGCFLAWTTSNDKRSWRRAKSHPLNREQVHWKGKKIVCGGVIFNLSSVNKAINDQVSNSWGYQRPQSNSCH